MAGEAGVVVMFNDRVSRDERLDDDVLNGPPNLLHVIAMQRHVRVEGGEFPEEETQGMGQGNYSWSANTTAW